MHPYTGSPANALRKGVERCCLSKSSSTNSNPSPVGGTTLSDSDYIFGVDRTAKWDSTGIDRLDLGRSVEVSEKESADFLVESHSRFTELQQRIKSWGIKRTAYWYLMSNVERYLGLKLVYVRVAANHKSIEEEEEPVVPAGYETRVVDQVDLMPFIGKEYDLTAEFLERAFSYGDECSATFYEGKLVGYGFISRQRATVTNQIDVTVPKGFRYGYKGWTHPDHRRRNLGKIRGYVRRRDTECPYSERNIYCIATHNYASLLHGYRHPNDRSISMGFSGYISILGRQIPFNSRKANWIGFRFVKRGDERPYQYAK